MSHIAALAGWLQFCSTLLEGHNLGLAILDPPQLLPATFGDLLYMVHGNESTLLVLFALLRLSLSIGSQVGFVSSTGPLVAVGASLAFAHMDCLQPILWAIWLSQDTSVLSTGPLGLCQFVDALLKTCHFLGLSSSAARLLHNLTLLCFFKLYSVSVRPFGYLALFH